MSLGLDACARAQGPLPRSLRAILSARATFLEFGYFPDMVALAEGRAYIGLRAPPRMSSARVGTDAADPMVNVRFHVGRVRVKPAQAFREGRLIAALRTSAIVHRRRLVGRRADARAFANVAFGGLGEAATHFCWRSLFACEWRMGSGWRSLLAEETGSWQLVVRACCQGW